ncbi:MAG TPA: isoprenyl transferase [Lachnospiraceae bacterium]|nr:isoprenyl transferase [Lachnospiraceae bacterium]
MMVPNHIAIILDGNGRWAKKRGLPRTAGHTQGAKNIETISRAAYKMGVKYLTIYVFSTENWKRPQSEVDAIMKLLNNYLSNCLKNAKKNNMQVRILGDKTRLDPDMQKKIAELEEVSKQYDGLNLNVAINYGSRDEIVRATRTIAEDVRSGKINPDDITDEMISNYLDTREVPDPDFLIRTSGEERLSNYLLWQLAYSEFYFTDVPWPDFSVKDLEMAIEEYNRRNRRYGNV